MRTGIPLNESAVKLTPDVFLLILGQRHGGPVTEFVRQLTLHFVPGDGRLVLQQLAAPIREAVLRNALVGYGLEVGHVAAEHIAQGHAARVVVGRHHYQRLVGMLQVEIVCHADGILQRQHLVHHATAVVAVGGMVYVALLHHHEEPVGRHLLQMAKACLGHAGQRQYAGY